MICAVAHCNAHVHAIANRMQSIEKNVDCNIDMNERCTCKVVSGTIGAHTCTTMFRERHVYTLQRQCFVNDTCTHCSDNVS